MFSTMVRFHSGFQAEIECEYEECTLSSKSISVGGDVEEIDYRSSNNPCLSMRKVDKRIDTALYDK